jgi:ABC-2 type transport system ATP-binding protein
VALDEVSVSFGRGELTALVGPNGAGKSTLLKILAGVLEPSAGHVHAPGTRAWIAQDPQLDPDMTVRATLSLMAALHHLPRAAVAVAVGRFGLGEFVEKTVRACSGGQRRRLHLAAGLLHSPDVIVLDEPLVGLDAELQATLWSELQAMRDRGASVVLATHDLRAVERLADVVHVFSEAKIVASGPPTMVRGDAQDLREAYIGLVGSAPGPRRGGGGGDGGRGGGGGGRRR